MTTRSTTARGLGWSHQQRRQHLVRAHRDGTPCYWCGKPMYRESAANWDGKALHADHSTARARGGAHADRLLHDLCNKQRGDGTRDHTRPSLGAAGPQAKLTTRNWLGR